jgi:hypothetical protein
MKLTFAFSYRLCYNLDIMASLKRAAEKSLGANVSPESIANRSEEIESVSNPIKRIGLRAVHTAAVKYPGATRKVLRTEEPKPELKKIGEGAQSLVYLLDEHTVVKIDIASLEMSKRERKFKASRMRYEHQLMCEYLGDTVLPHSVKVAAHPFIPDVEPIQIFQDYVNVDYVDLAANAETSTRIVADIQERTKKHPSATSQIKGFIDRNLALYADHKLIGDILGENNVGFDQTNTLLQTDAQPVNTQHIGIQRIIAGHFNILDKHLVN